MKQRNAFTTDNTRGLSDSELERANRAYDRWAHNNPFHGADFKGYQLRSETAKGAIMEGLERDPPRVPIGAADPKPPLKPGCAVTGIWPDGSADRQSTVDDETPSTKSS